MSSFPIRLKQARTAAKLTQENLAMELGISKSQVSAWENGKEKPSWKHLEPMRRFLRVSIDWLLVGPTAALQPASSDSIGDPATDMTVYQAGSMDLAVRLLRDMPEEQRQLIIQIMFLINSRQMD